MRYGIWSPTNPRDGVSLQELYRQQIEEIEIADALGFDHFWLYEHHVSPTGPMPSPNLMIAAAALRTQRIRLGTMINILPYRNPLIVAEEAAMLDTLTGGRLDVGIGRGLRPAEFEAFCIPQSQAREMLEESLALVMRIWADENFEHHGRHFHVNKQSPLSPPVVQRPHPPIYMSAQSEDSLRFAALNNFAVGQIDALFEDCQRDMRFYCDVQRAAGMTPSPRLFVTREIYVADTMEEARQQAYPWLVKYWQIWQRYTQFAAEGRLPADYEQWHRRAPMLAAMRFEELIERGLVLVGTADFVAEQVVLHRRELDLDVLACVFKFGGMPFDMVKRSMKAFATEVMPKVREIVQADAAE
jgi:alkanesulfonate monooxygenase SsuD/methylene tetrahydromethanopterin reductase-like flavin-dependent oxidoreductase (luciferase family)